MSKMRDRTESQSGTPDQVRSDAALAIRAQNRRTSFMTTSHALQGHHIPEDAFGA